MKANSWALLVALALTACGPKVVYEEMYVGREGDVDVRLRRMEKGGEPVPRGYLHPARISDVRLAHILANLQWEDAKGRARPTIRSLHVYDLAEGLAHAFMKATPDDEVIARAYMRDKNLVLFTTARATALRGYFQGDVLVLEFFALEERIERDRAKNYEATYRIPTNFPESPLTKNLIPGEAVVLRGGRGYAVDWRDPFFRRPVSLSLGGIRRRTILLEAAPEAEEFELPEVTPDAEGGGEPARRTEVRDAQLRAFDQLDSARRAGLITEGEFQRRRRLILEGRLEEAGYGPEP